MSDTDYNAITVHPGGEITVNRSYEARYLDCMIEVMQLEDHIAELDAENRALREFVAAHDKHEAFRETVATDGYELWIAEWEHLKREAKAARNRLAAEHGLPLPGAGEGV